MDDTSGDDVVLNTSQNGLENGFTTDSKLWFPKAPDIAVKLATKQIARNRMDLRTLTQGKVISMIKQKVLEHKWDDAALLMKGLAGQVVDPRYLPSKFIWEVGNEIIYNHPLLKLEPILVRDHKIAAHNLSASDVCHARILYEFGLWFLKIGDLNEAREVFRSFHANGVRQTFHVNYKIHQDMMVEWLPIFEAYLGMIDWIQWKGMPDQESTIDDEDELSPRALIAEQAISHFEVAFESPGIWDIFMLKYLEILEHSSRILDAEEALRIYALKNPNNPNAHKYWYRFLLRHPNTMDNLNCRIQTLSSLHEIAPSEYFMLDLYQLRLASAFAVKDRNYDQFVSMSTIAIGIIMDMLDFDKWKCDSNSWNEFYVGLQSVKDGSEKSDFEIILDTVWVETRRDSWWPQYHFCKTEAENALKIGAQFAASKERIAVIFLGSKSKLDWCL